MKLPDDYEFEPGFYYVGDLCYYFDDEEWDKVLEISKLEDGIYTLPDGRVFGWFGTAWGDGEYYDQVGRAYSVDSGTIGLVKVSPDTKRIGGGQIMEFTKPFKTMGFDRVQARSRDGDGVIRIGPVKIETNPQPEEEEY